MKQKFLFMDWMAKFSCIGGPCPLTCCSAKWNIALTDEEIARYENLDHPFRDELMGYVDKEKKCLKTRGDVCACLTEDGWCKLVRACGEEQLSGTCVTFPRTVKSYGDIEEATVEIVCPVVAGYLLDTTPIEFGLEEIEVSTEGKPADFQIYDSLSLARTYLMDLIQDCPWQFVPGKLYIMLSVMYKIRELCENKTLNKETVQSVLAVYDQQEIRNDIFSQCEALAGRYEVKSVLLQNLLIQFQKIIVVNLADTLKLDEKLQNHLELWVSDTAALTEDIKGFAQYMAESYPAMAENFLVYILFLDWITMDLEKFGHNLSARVVELSLIQIFAMSRWKQDGEIDREAFEVLIASVDRKVSHGSDFLRQLYEFITELGKDSLANILMIVI